MTSTQKVCGLGTGRCGTRSLTAILQAQPGFDAEHERPEPLSWDDDTDFHRHFAGQERVADVGFYYLPYVPRLIEAYPDMRFVCLKRDRTATIRSFRRSQPLGTNWFSDGERREDRWDRSFPKYGGSFGDAAGRYWDDYYETAAEYAGRFEKRFLVFDTDRLNCAHCVRELLVFAGFDNPKVLSACIGD